MLNRFIESVVERRSDFEDRMGLKVSEILEDVTLEPEILRAIESYIPVSMRHTLTLALPREIFELFKEVVKLEDVLFSKITTIEDSINERKSDNQAGER